MTPQTLDRATLDDLMRYDGIAELISGVIVPKMGTGSRPARVGGRIYRFLDDYAVATGRGVAHPDGCTFAVPELSSRRESFVPDASYYSGPMPANDMGFIDGAPDLAVEVRSEHDHGPKPERVMAEKRADYFEAGTLVVWDVDPVANTVRAYAADAPESPRVFAATDTADAEPHLPGWRLPLAGVFA